MWTARVPTMVYSTRTQLPIGGRHYAADIVLQFYQNRLGAIMIAWPVTAFITVDTWKRATYEIFQQLIDTYDPSLIVDHNPPTYRSRRFGATLGLKDASGNRLHLTSGDFEIMLAYLWNVYAEAVDRSPATSPASPRANF